MCFLQNISKSQNKCLEFVDWIKSQPIGLNNLISKRGRNGLNDEGANWFYENFNFYYFLNLQITKLEASVYGEFLMKCFHINI